MKRMAIALFVIVGITAATSAMAVELRAQKSGVAQPQQVRQVGRFTTTAVLSCDDGIESNAYFQGTDDRLGNVFNFGTGATLSAVGFDHFGFGFAGPYNYDIELWDVTSCTMIAARNGLVASDAANASVFEVVDLCANNFFLAGDVAVMIDPNTCINPGDCYPDLVFDDQLNINCPWLILTASTTPGCIDLAPYNGPFILRVATNDCPTPTAKHSWGGVKTLYR